MLNSKSTFDPMPIATSEPLESNTFHVFNANSGNNNMASNFSFELADEAQLGYDLTEPFQQSYFPDLTTNPIANSFAVSAADLTGQANKVVESYEQVDVSKKSNSTTTPKSNSSARKRKQPEEDKEQKKKTKPSYQRKNIKYVDEGYFQFERISV